MAVQYAAPASEARPSNVFTRDEIKSDTELSCDVVVVGSGAGGATIAAEFAEAGYEVVVLEEGSYYRTEDFTPNATEMIRKMYRGGGATMAIGSPPVLYQEGSAVGGSTVVNGGMSWRTPEQILDRWSREAGIDHIKAADMELYFERVERRIHVALQDPESIGRDNQLLKAGADKLNWKVIPNLRNQLHCPGSNNCAFGCPTGAKQSALVSYIPRALHYGARIYSDVRVASITRNGKRANGVVGHVIAANGDEQASVRVHAKLVVSSCGSVHTPALLHRSGFRSRSRRLGHNLSLHPNTKLVAIFDEPVRGWEGVHQAYQVREFHDQGFLFAAVNVPPSVIAMSTPYYGQQMSDLLALYDRTIVAGLMVEDTAVGHLKMMPGGHPQAFYQLNDFDAAQLVRGTALLAELLFETGAKRILPPFAGVGELTSVDDLRRLYSSKIPKSSMEVLTVHIMGSACMGSDPSRSVTNMFGMVHDTEGLMVADASLFPTPVGVNPMETIQALATRNAHHVLQSPRSFLL
jgi:choline dehydrogenase-like flavoprotein